MGRKAGLSDEKLRAVLEDDRRHADLLGLHVLGEVPVVVRLDLGVRATLDLPITRGLRQGLDEGVARRRVDASLQSIYILLET